MKSLYTPLTGHLRLSMGYTESQIRVSNLFIRAFYGPLDRIFETEDEGISNIIRWELYE